MNIYLFLSNAPLFGGLSEAHIRDLAKVAAERTLQAGDILFHEGQKSSAIYLLASGSVQLHKSSTDGRKTIIKVVSVGELFAEVTLFERSTYPVTAVALAPSTVIGLQCRDIRAHLRDEAFQNDFFALLMRRQRSLAERIRILSTPDVGERFRLFLQSQYGRQRRIECPMKRKELAAAILVTPETLSRLLRQLRKEQLVSWTQRTIEIQDAFWSA